MALSTKKTCFKRCGGFTLAELIVGLMITAIIMAATASLVFAIGSASDVSSDADSKQAQVRFSTLRIRDVLRNCRLILAVNNYDFIIWLCDTNNNGLMNLNELVYLGGGDGRTYIRELRFNSTSNPLVFMSDLQAAATSWWDKYGTGISTKTTMIVPVCSNVALTYNAAPPRTQFAGISCDISENGFTHNYQTYAVLRAYAGHLLDSTGNVVSDDDENGSSW